MGVIMVANIDVKDLEKYKSSGYLENTGKISTYHGGRYRVRAGEYRVYEGSPEIKGRVIMIEFPSFEKFEDFYLSKEYKPWKKIRHEMSDGNIYVIETLTNEESDKIADKGV